MKKLIFIIVFLAGLQHVSTAQPQPPVTDTLQWLRTNIEQQQHLFVGKPLKVMLDSLGTLKQGILQYSPPYSEMWGRPDTIWSNDVELYFGEPYGGGALFQIHTANPGINTHVPVIYIELSWPVPFLRKWFVEDRDGLGSTNWNSKLEAFWGQHYVQSITIEEY